MNKLRLCLGATPGGGFSESDEAAHNALKRASCQSKPANVVLENGGNLNAIMTAKNLVCAKAWGVSEESIAAELSAKHGVLCGDASTCPLRTTLEGWLKQATPVVLTAKN